MVISEPGRHLQSGAYQWNTTMDVIQHASMGGGHPGCGGAVFALEFTEAEQFLLYEFRSDCRGLHHRTMRCESREAMLALWDRVYTSVTWGEGFTPWTKDVPIFLED